MISGWIELKQDLWEAQRAFLLLGPTLKTGSLHQHWNKEETSQWHQVTAGIKLLHTGIKEQKLVAEHDLSCFLFFKNKILCSNVDAFRKSPLISLLQLRADLIQFN